MSRRALYAGSFDPVTIGHVDVIARSAKMFDEIIIGVGSNPKKPGLFTASERVELLKDCCKHLENIQIEAFTGLTADFAREKKCSILIRGLRDSLDFGFELQMAHMNRHLVGSLDTVFIPCLQQYSNVSSSLVKEIASLGGNITGLVPLSVERKLIEKLAIK